MANGKLLGVLGYERGKREKGFGWGKEKDGTVRASRSTTNSEKKGGLAYAVRRKRKKGPSTCGSEPSLVCPREMVHPTSKKRRPSNYTAGGEGGGM